MKFAKKLFMAFGFVGVAALCRFTSMNSAIDLVTATLMAMSLSCGFTASFIGWSLFGVVLEVSYLAQGGFSMVMGVGLLSAFAIAVLTCATIGAAVGGLVKLTGGKALLLSPAFVLAAKWLLAFLQDFYLLLFNPAMAPVWLGYHMATEVWALAKIGQAVFWYMPVYAALLGLAYAKRHRLFARPMTAKLPE